MNFTIHNTSYTSDRESDTLDMSVESSLRIAKELIRADGAFTVFGAQAVRFFDDGPGNKVENRNVITSLSKLIYTFR
jgi:hypothetical protein